MHMRWANQRRILPSGGEGPVTFVREGLRVAGPRDPVTWRVVAAGRTGVLSGPQPDSRQEDDKRAVPRAKARRFTGVET